MAINTGWAREKTALGRPRWATPAPTSLLWHGQLPRVRGSILEEEGLVWRLHGRALGPPPPPTWCGWSLHELGECSRIIGGN